MIVQNLSTLKINKMSQAQYDRELAAGNLDSDELYLIPETMSETSGLPEVSAADNGSFLRVVNGEWKIVKYNVYDGSVV